jgi:hypothetical protein
MNHYTIHRSNGEIVKFGSTNEDLSTVSVDDGMLMLAKQCPQEAHLYKVVAGEIVRKTDDEIRATNFPRDFAIFKGMRDQMLAASDWTQSVDSPLSAEQKQVWATYRQKLRDLPESTTDPSNPQWPEKPT